MWNLIGSVLTAGTPGARTANSERYPVHLCCVGARSLMYAACANTLTISLCCGVETGHVGTPSLLLYDSEIAPIQVRHGRVDFLAPQITLGEEAIALMGQRS